MFDSLVEVVKMLDRSTRHVAMVVVVTLVVISGLIVYDGSLKESRLTRLEHSVALLRDSAAMISSTSDAELRDAGITIRTQALDTIQSSLSPVPHSAYEKFMAAIAPWFALFVLLCFVGGETGLVENFLNSGPLLLCGAAFGFIGAFLPDSQLPWFNMVVYPAGHFVLVVVVTFFASLNKWASAPDFTTSADNAEEGG